MKIVKPLEELGLLIKGIRKIIKNEAKEQKRVFLPMLISTLAAFRLGNELTVNALTRKGVIKTGAEKLELARIFNTDSSFK